MGLRLSQRQDFIDFYAMYHNVPKGQPLVKGN